MIRKRSPLTLRGAAVATVATAGLVLTARGGSGDSAGHDSHAANSPSAAASTPAPQEQHNAADVAFGQGMWSPTTARPWRWPISPRPAPRRPR